MFKRQLLVLVFASLFILPGIGMTQGKDSSAQSLQGQLNSLKAQVTTLQGQVATLQGQVVNSGTEINTLKSQISALQSGQSSTDTKVAGLEGKLQCVSVENSGDDFVFTGCNVHVRNGESSTSTTNGLGNLIIGYNEE